MASPAQTTAQVSVVRGRPFEKGNSGRRPGSKNRGSLVLAALLEGEKEALIRKAVELAKAGDVQMLKFLLGRILPRERPVAIELPQMEFADDAMEALGAVTRTLSEGSISPSEAAAVATLVNSFVSAIEMADVVKRLDALEAKVRGVASA
jgi:hypothetical protein